jgi:hypothetical protein
MMDRKISFGFAGYVDDLMAAGTTWDALERRAEEEAARRGVDPIMASRSKLEAHVKWRRDHNKWQVAYDDESVRLTMPFMKTWSNW